MRFLSNIGVYSRALGDMPTSEFVLRALRRVPGLDGTRLRRAIALSDRKGTDPIRMSGFLDRLEKLARERTGRDLGLAGARVLEVGCGPLGGFAPFLIARGAVAIAAIEPDWDQALFDHAAVERTYLAAVAEALGAPWTSSRLRAALAETFAVTRGGLEETTLEGPFDIAVSQSCLEHVRDLDASARTLKRILAPQARQAHLVNFGNHRRREHPFETIYEMPPTEYRSRYGRHINLGRPSDVAKAFAAAGLEVEITPIDVAPDSLARVTLHPWWRERYAAEELAVRTAIVTTREAAW